MRQPWRVVVRSYKYTTSSHPHGTFSRVHVLECGHELRRKGSAGTPRRMRCDYCKAAP